MADLPQRPGYIRGAPAIHRSDDWRIEVESEQRRVGVLVVETADGPVQFALDERTARDALAALQRFLDGTVP